MNAQTVIADWLSGEKIAGVLFSLNEPVHIVGGRFTGLAGSVISIETLSPEPQYLIELTSGQDVTVPQSWLTAAG